MAKKTAVAPETKEEQIAEGTPAADTLKPHSSGAVGKSAMMAMAMEKLAGMSIEDMTHWFNASIAQIGHEADKIPSGAAAHNKATINAKEEIDDVIGDTLNEEAKEKVQVIFESTINARLAVELQKLEEEFEEKLTEQIQAIHDEITERTQKYVEYASGEFMKENQVAIEASLKTEIVEDFIEGMKNLFAENYIEIPEEKFDVVEEMSQEIEKLTAQLNSAIETNIEQQKQIEEHTKNGILETLKEGLTLTQAEKFSTLSETVEYENADDYKRKLEVIKEHHFGGKKPDTKAVVENTVEPSGVSEPKEQLSASPEIRGYMDAISKTVSKTR